MTETEAQLDGLIREIRSTFFIPLSSEDTFANLRALASVLPADYRLLAEAFDQNLASFLSTVTMPFALASTSVHQSHFQRIHIAERIRAQSLELNAIGLGESPDAVRDREAYRKADGRMKEFVESEQGRNAIIRDTCRFLLDGVRHGLADAAQELLHQGAILLWSAFEVFFRDTFELYLNRDPRRANVLIRHPDTRKRFEAEKVSLDTLLQHGFDLSGKIGSILVRQQDFSDLRTVKAVYPVLFPAAGNLITAIGSRDLWVLFQKRHLIVHRRSVVDQAYVEATGESLPIGTRLVVTPAKLESDLRTVLQNGEALCACLGAEPAAA